MSIPRFSLGHRPLVLALVAVFMGVGLFNFFTMPRREDPQILVRDALVVTSWPGASAKKIEELVTDPLEDVIVEIAEVS
ncbi:MAG: efflux RND transporter permease subunit, partial [Acidobacteriota bacterium]